MVGQDLLTEEAIQRKMAALRTELIEPNASPLERLLVDRVVALWLHLHKLEGEAAIVGDKDATQATYYQRRDQLGAERVTSWPFARTHQRPTQRDVSVR